MTDSLRAHRAEVFLYGADKKKTPADRSLTDAFVFTSTV